MKKKPNTQKKKKFTYGPGRGIDFDGSPYVSVNKEGSTSPTQADYTAKLIVKLLNGSAAAQKVASAKGGYLADDLDDEHARLENPKLKMKLLR